MVYLDDSLPHHPKIVRAGQLAGKDGHLLALGLFVSALCYARHYLTDGVLPAAFFERTSGGTSTSHRALRALITVGLVRRRKDRTYEIHDYAQWNESAAQVKEKRRVDRERKAAWRAARRGVTVGVTAGQASDTGNVPDLSQVPRATTSTTTSTTTTTERESDTRALVDAYVDRFLDKTGQRPQIEATDRVALEALLEAGHEPATICDALDAMFEHGDEFVQQAGYPLRLFRKQFNSYLARAVPKASWCGHEPPCINHKAHYTRVLAEPLVESEP